MEKILVLFFALAVFMAGVQAGAEPLGNAYNAMDNCTTVVLMPDATASGNLIIGKNRDLSVDACQHIVFMPREEHSASEHLRLSKEVIPQVNVTYGWLGSQTWNAWGVGMGVNEFSVAIMINDASTDIREKTIKGRGIEGDEMARLVLERCKSAKEGVGLIGDFVDKYGHGEGSVGQIYVLADPEDAWVVESTTTQWVAEEIKSGVEARANQFQISNTWDLGSKDVVSYAVSRGWASEQNFNFAKAYSEGWPFGHSQTRYDRANALLQPKRGNLSIHDAIRIFRDHYEGTEHYEYPLHYYSKDSNRPICVNRTGASWVIELRKGYPGDIAAQIWIASGSPCTSVYSPFYLCSDIPNTLSVGNNSYSNTSLWWKLKALQQWVDEDYRNRSVPVITVFRGFEHNEFQAIDAAEKMYTELQQGGNKAGARAVINSFTSQCVNTIDAKVTGMLSQAGYAT